MRSIDFFHIPSSGGRFFYQNTANLLRYSFYQLGSDSFKQITIDGHRSIPSKLDKDSLSFCIIREPLSRTISHYMHLYMMYDKFIEGKTKSEFLNYLHDNPDDSLINYQTKFLSITSGEAIDIYNRNMQVEPSFSKAQDSLKRVKYVFSTDQLTSDLVKNVRQTMADHLEIQNLYPDALVPKSDFSNPNSMLLLSSLSLSEKRNIEELLKLDMDLFESRHRDKRKRR